MPKLVLYGIDFSPPVRACLMTLRALNLPFEYKQLEGAELKSEAYLKMNPQHTIPVLDDDGTYFWDSHAICCYLVDKYGKSDDLYPKDLIKRAHLQQRLYFEASVLFMSLRNITVPFFYKQVTQVPQEKIDNIYDACDHLENFLGDNLYVTGNSLTIADFSCATTVSSLPFIVDLDPVKYPKIQAWLDRLGKLPYFQEFNPRGVQMCIDLLKSSLTKV